MKKVILLVCFAVFNFYSFAQDQLLNNSFENWSTNGSLSIENPDDWWGGPVSCTGLGGGQNCISTTNKTTDAHTGTYALKISNLSNHTVGQITYILKNQEYYNFTLRPDALTGFYKFNKGGSDIISISVSLSGATIDDTIAFGTKEITSSETAYTQFTVPIIYSSTDTPQHILITISFNDYADISSFFILDDVNLNYNVTTATSAKSINRDVKFFPNPSSEFIQFENAVNGIEVSMPNGTSVLRLSEQTNSLNIGSLEPGIYILSYKNNDHIIHTRLVKE